VAGSHKGHNKEPGTQGPQKGTQGVQRKDPAHGPAQARKLITGHLADQGQGHALKDGGHDHDRHAAEKNQKLVDGETLRGPDQVISQAGKAVGKTSVKWN
jgi:hypothetical protein